ncbi:ATP-binding protein [Actinacidiphila bryophytorum]|uniref:ATP-binding protein n=1 Tax=Actinacidiphila bryophytorum TaxID=1436133 RepID=UPI002AFDF74F|nr:ATP-binding protein [Actinacidiphila bryophytorum]
MSTDDADSFLSGLADDLDSEYLEMAGSDLPSTLVYRWRRDPSIVVRVRRLLVWHLDAWDMKGLADVAELVVSELVTNAVQHAHGPEDALVETRFERLPGGDLRIEVHDANENKPELRQLSPDAESGRGLALVDALTSGRWGASGREGVGKLLWAECAADDDRGEMTAEVRGGRRRERPRRLNQEPEAVTWARARNGLTKRRLAELVGISEQLMGEVESGWRSATPANLAKITEALNCPVVVLERSAHTARTPTAGPRPDCGVAVESCREGKSRGPPGDPGGPLTCSQWTLPDGDGCWGCCAWLLYRRIATGVTMERQVLEKLLAGDDEVSAAALAALRSGATYSVWDTTHPAEQHAGVFAFRLRRMRRRGVEPLGLERMVRLLREHGRPVRGGLIDSADQKWSFLCYFTEDGGALVACARLQRWVEQSRLQESE